MRAPAPYSTTYRHDRRKHQHRCRCCWKIIEADTPVVMAKVGQRGGRQKTFALHEACADKRHSDTFTWRKVFAEWSRQHAKACGFRIPEQEAM